MKYIPKAFLLILILSFTISCYSDNKEDLYQDFVTADCDTTNTKFAATIQPIIAQNCAVPFCHNTSDRQSGLDLSTYSDVKKVADDGRLENRITGNPGPIMPPGGPLPQCEVDKILRWVINGAQNN
tara:strand:+ start:341 stop:718 length:378 start_codon:yes stop_codon:yes gene_type:complete